MALSKISVLLVVASVIEWTQGTHVYNQLRSNEIKSELLIQSTTDVPVLLPDQVKPQVPIFMRARKSAASTYVIHWGDIEALMLEGFMMPIVKPQGPPSQVPTLDPESLPSLQDNQGILEDSLGQQDPTPVAGNRVSLRKKINTKQIDVSATHPLMCGSYDLETGVVYTIETPYFPNGYVGKFKCKWTLTALDGDGFHIDCPDFQLAAGDVFTTMVVDDPTTFTKYQWKNGPVHQDMLGEAVLLSFSSNKKKHAQGFSCTVTTLNPLTTMPPSTVSTSTSTTPTTTTSTTKTSTTTSTTKSTSPTSTTTTIRLTTPTSTTTTPTSTTTTPTSTTTTPTRTTTATTSTSTTTKPTTTATTTQTTTTTTPTTTTTKAPTTTTKIPSTTTTVTTTTTIPTTSLPPLSHPDCGIANRAAVKVVNGQSATPNEYPWQSFLEIRWTDGKSQLCGGSLITRQWILTAAHCVLRKFDNGSLWKPSVDVTLGMHTRLNPLADGGFKVPAAAVEIYPENNFSHDLALIRLPSLVEYRKEVRPVCLPNRYLFGKNVTGELMALIGWGKTETGQLTNELREVSSYGIEAVICRKVFGSYITDHHFCTSGTGVKHICLGDSGGPVMTMDRGRFTLTGVVSFVATQDCTGEYPDGHTAVTYFLDWIQTMVNQTLF